MSETKSTRKTNLTTKENTKYENIFVHLTLVTELIKKENGETKCICNNIIIPQQPQSLPSNTPQEHNPSSQNEASILPKQDPSIFFETEIIPSLQVPTLPDGRILLSDIAIQLKSLGYPITGSLISIYINKVEDYVFIGAEPLDQNLFLDPKDVDMSCVKIKIVSYIEDKLVKKTEKQLFDRKDCLCKKSKDKRTKERRIGFIVEKVNAWRKLYNGFYNENGEHTRYSLDQAAKMIDISKKSLDDYLLQLRLGRKYGFDFNLNKNSKVGVLRTFVKMHRGMKSNTNTDIPDQPK
jgi:hypothetical protein